MDLDIEMGDAREGVQAAPFVELPTADDILQPNEPEEPGEVADDGPATEGASDASKSIVPNKIHIRGLDSLHTNDIKDYIKKQYGQVDRVEWIDDTSANLLFSSDLTAREALSALSNIEIVDITALAPGEMLPAKPVEGKPEISLLVRPALESDKKEAGAALRSRYYLLHPEHDPEERRRQQQQQDDRSRYRKRDDDRRGGDRRRRRSDDDIETFEASMYDDAPAPKRKDEPSPYAEKNHGKELFTSRRTARNRSASPNRDRDGDADMDEMRSSSYRNRASARSIKDRLSTENTGKELFPSRSSDNSHQLDNLEESIGSARLKESDMPKIVGVSEGRGSKPAFSIKGGALQTGPEDAGFVIKGTASKARELFPDTLGSSNAGKELLDASRLKRRQKAHDLFS